MKKNQILIAAAMGCTLLMSACATQAPETDNSMEQIKAMLTQHDDAVNEHNLKGVMALFADDPAIVMMGTGPGEFWKGKADVESAYQQLFKDFKAGSLKHQCPDASIGQQGEFAWLIASCNIQDVSPDGSQKREYGLNVSAVLKKGKEGWKFQTLHFSNLTDGGAPPPEGAAPAAPPAEAPKKAQ